MKGKRKKFSTAKPHKRKPKFKSKIKSNSSPNSASFARLAKNPAHPQQHASKTRKSKPPKTQNLKSTPSFVLKDDEAPP